MRRCFHRHVVSDIPPGVIKKEMKSFIQLRVVLNHFGPQPAMDADGELWPKHIQEASPTSLTGGCVKRRMRDLIHRS